MGQSIPTRSYLTPTCLSFFRKYEKYLKFGVSKIDFKRMKWTDLLQDWGNYDDLVAECSLMDRWKNNYTGLTTTSY
jgi:hypothetical protein